MPIWNPVGGSIQDQVWIVPEGSGRLEILPGRHIALEIEGFRSVTLDIAASPRQL